MKRRHTTQQNKNNKKQNNTKTKTTQQTTLTPPDVNQLNESINQLVSQVSIPQLKCDTNEQTPRGTKEIKKLGELRANGMIEKSRATRIISSGHRQAGVPSSRMKPGCKVPILVLTISRKGTFSVYLKKAFQHFDRHKTGKISLVAMGCAVSMCFSIALAIQSNLQLGPATRLLKSVQTGTVVVGDQISPLDQKIDFTYQTRNIPSIEIQLMIEFIPDQLKSIASKSFS